jgi:membrane protein DedA with SNARE-associated domain
MEGKRLSDIPNNLSEFVVDRFLKLKGFIIGLYENQFFLILILFVVGILIYYLLRYSIGLKLGQEEFKNKKKNKNQL